MATVKIKNLLKKYGELLVLDQVNLEIPEGSLVSLLGPSGCGKTTTLRLIAGFEQADGGDIYIGEQRVNDISVNKRNIGMVFQSYALFPHMTVWQNVAYGLEQRKIPKDEIQRKVSDILKLVHLEGYEKRKPKQLSGGQQQRVALARALVIEPEILLLDESLSALDKNLRVQMQIELRRILEASKITALFVTHDQEEALTLSDYIVVMNKGKIVQAGTPWEVYENPRNSFVASFLGQANYFEGKATGHCPEGIVLETAYGTVSIPTSHPAEIGKNAKYAIRPEKILLSGENGEGRLAGEVQFVTYAGNSTTYTIDVQGQKMIAEVQNASSQAGFKAGDPVYLSWDKKFCLLMED